MSTPTQTPCPGTRTVRHRGDVLTFEVRVEGPVPARAFLRTNLGRGTVRLAEILAFAEEGRAVLHRDWHDLPMRETGPGRFRIDLPLVETGLFEAKAFLLLNGEEATVWVPGENVRIKVESEESTCLNSIYTVFPRQFRQQPELDDGLKGAVGELDRLGYHVIPPAGTFRDVMRRLDEIVALRVRILQLLPVHPVPTTFARMGRFGSPFAAGDYRTVNPAQAEFDPGAPPMAQFRELVDAAHARGMRVFLDMPANHTGWASALQNHHPEWFQRTPDGAFVQPGAWGVVWEDLVALDYGHHSLWRYMGEVFLHWCRHGVDGFRCDAGYMLPPGAWQYILAKVRSEYPDAVFLLEGLGGPKATTETLLGDIGLDWAYSELFQTHGREELYTHLAESARTARAFGTLVHFAETHDNNRLAATSPTYARMRTALSALCSEKGAFGITNGVEWFATEKVDVHGASELNWGSETNQREHLRRLAAILESHPAYLPGAEWHRVQSGDANALALRRVAPGGEEVVVLVNLDCEHRVEVTWEEHADHFHGSFCDLLSGECWRPRREGTRCALELAPGQVLCLTDRMDALAAVNQLVSQAPPVPQGVCRQRLRSQGLALRVACGGYADLAGWDVDRELPLLAEEPRAFVHKLLGGPVWVPVVEWQAGRDERRCVLVPPGHFLLLRSSLPFAVRLSVGGRVRAARQAFPLNDGRWAVLLPVPDGVPGDAQLVVESYDGRETHRATGTLRVLAGRPEAPLRLRAGRRELGAPTCPHAVLGNGLGGMAQVRAAWGRIASKYDAFLAANLHPAHPVDRTVVLTRVRGWVVHRDYSCDLDTVCQTGFEVDGEGRPVWEFEVPVGMGRQVRVQISLTLRDGANEGALRVARLGRVEDALDAARSVRLILRPDLEWRSSHTVTKAYLGPEHAFRSALAMHPDGFDFAPAPSPRLRLRCSRGSFVREPEWAYGVELPVDAERGMPATTDVFSPGYFAFALKQDEAAVIAFGVGDAPPDMPEEGVVPLAAPVSPAKVLRRSLASFVVRRDDSRTVIAGYPWFLDWGRDTLIFLRGMIADGNLALARDILLQFARFEERGTLPNMIRGGDQSDRDTSDAPLWFLVVARELTVALPKTERLLDEPCAGRPLREVLLSIGANYLRGTPNGIVADAASGLVFSPSHFTWMDTNHPAGSPREGYPIEIQALWHAGLRFLGEIDPTGDWHRTADRVRASVARLFVRPGLPGLSDCLHAVPGTPARAALADDALRPNQLFAVTLGDLLTAEMARAVVLACEELLTPCGIRSLADRPVECPLPVRIGEELLNDPRRPYAPAYSGDEDRRRKPAYHNGTAWKLGVPELLRGPGEGIWPVGAADGALSAVLVPRRAGKGMPGTHCRGPRRRCAAPSQGLRRPGLGRLRTAARDGGTPSSAPRCELFRPARV